MRLDLAPPGTIWMRTPSRLWEQPDAGHNSVDVSPGALPRPEIRAQVDTAGAAVGALTPPLSLAAEAEVREGDYAEGEEHGQRPVAGEVGRHAERERTTSRGTRGGWAWEPATLLGGRLLGRQPARL